MNFCLQSIKENLILVIYRMAMFNLRALCETALMPD